MPSSDRPDPELEESHDTGECEQCGGSYTNHHESCGQLPLLCESCGEASAHDGGRYCTDCLKGAFGIEVSES